MGIGVILGSAQVTVPYSWPSAYLYIGTWTGTFSHISVGVFTYDDGVHLYNDVLADSIWATSG